jgi:light-regulated signal transduction histidine kinase (bacteriophytochrome)
MNAVAGKIAFGESARAREPIDIPGAIQPHGARLAAQAEGGLMTHATANPGRVPGQDAAAGLGRPLAEIFGEATSRLLMAAAASTVVHMLPRSGGHILQRRACRSEHRICMAPRYFERIFGMFRQLRDRDESTGAWIGLAICRKIIEHHNGTISVESGLGEGPVFQSTLLAAGAGP